MKIILDTNFMMECFHYKVDLSQIFDLYPGTKLATIPQVVQEIKSIAGKKTKHSKYAKVALGLIDGFDVVEAPEGKADDVLVEITGKDMVVATNDAKLRSRIKRKGLKTIYLRGRKQLAVG